MNPIASLAAALAALPLMASAQTPNAPRPAPRTFTALYVCEDARVVGVTQALTRAADQPLTITFGIEAKELKRAQSAAGTTYVDDARTWTWQSDGGAFTLGDLERNEPLARTCRPFGSERHMKRPTTPSRELSK